VPIYLAYELVVGESYVGDTAFKLAIATKANELFGVGTSVLAERVRALIWDEELALGVEDMISFALGTAPAPIAAVNIPIATRQIPRFSSANIEVVT
jgi:hypothetical protein